MYPALLICLLTRNKSEIIPSSDEISERAGRGLVVLQIIANARLSAFTGSLHCSKNCSAVDWKYGITVGSTSLSASIVCPARALIISLACGAPILINSTPARFEMF
jgi:hypothetical protein